MEISFGIFPGFILRFHHFFIIVSELLHKSLPTFGSCETFKDFSIFFFFEFRWDFLPRFFYWFNPGFVQSYFLAFHQRFLSVILWGFLTDFFHGLLSRLHQKLLYESSWVFSRDFVKFYSRVFTRDSS